MGRSPRCGDEGVKKGPWTSEEDDKLRDYIKLHGHGSWRELPRQAGLNRCGKSCRLRWTNYLRPDIKRGKFAEEEEEKIIQLHAEMGNKWSAIASKLPGRTDNEIKNHWNTHLRKKLMKKGIDPVTHKPRPEFTLMAALTAGLQGGNGADTAAFNPHQLQAELAQWARFQLAESIIQVLAAAAPGFNSHVAAAAVPHNIMGPVGTTINQLPLPQGGSWGSNLPIVSSGCPGVVNGGPSHPTATTMPAAHAASNFSPSPLSELPCFPRQTAMPNSINHSLTPTNKMPMHQHPDVYPSSGFLTKNPNISDIAGNMTWSYSTSSIQTAANSTLPRETHFDVLDALMAELDIPSIDSSASVSAVSVSAATPSEEDGFSNCDFLDVINFQDISSWPSTGFLMEKLPS